MASDGSPAWLPERQWADVVEALVIALVVIVLDVFTHDGSKMPLANGHDVTQAPVAGCPAASPCRPRNARRVRPARAAARSERPAVHATEPSSRVAARAVEGATAAERSDQRDDSPPPSREGVTPTFLLGGPPDISTLV